MLHILPLLLATASAADNPDVEGTRRLLRELTWQNCCADAPRSDLVFKAYGVPGMTNPLRRWPTSRPTTTTAGPPSSST
jgi:hypothetical protein